MYNSANRLRRLILNLLQWARSQTGRIEYNPENNDLKFEIDENISLLIESAEAKNLNLYSEIEENTFVYGDKNMIKTVIRNLISNAIKFTHNGGEIKISSKNKNDFIEVAVIDTGIGISKENITKLFRIDAQYTTYGTAEEKGSGLGLILCREFIEKNGGKIWIESELEKGSAFKFTLPQKQV